MGLITLSNGLSLRWVKQDNELSKQAQTPDLGPKLDLGFKEGQTITLNIGVKALYLHIILQTLRDYASVVCNKVGCTVY